MDSGLPEGFRYVPDFVSPEEEKELLNACRALPLDAVTMRGFTAKRRTAHFGVVYGYDSWSLTPGPPIPAVFEPLRERAAALAEIRPTDLSELLISEYSPGATIGWHRDAPMFGPTVIGVSLGAACRMRLRRTDPVDRAVQRASIVLEPRSAYVMAGPARRELQHSIPAVDALRYSVTFRTVLASSARRRSPRPR